jgi:hypothetical protein
MLATACFIDNQQMIIKSAFSDVQISWAKKNRHVTGGELMLAWIYPSYFTLHVRWLRCSLPATRII